MNGCPDFLIIGAGKSGTTALYEYLVQHPDIFMTEPKEPHYFAFRGATPRFRGPGDELSINRRAITDREGYRRLFAARGGAKAAGEASVSYLYYPEAMANIRRETAAIKLICMLRNPADRAYSAYSFMRSLALEPCDDFRAALANEPRRIAMHWHHMWHYRAMSRYAEQVARCLDTFPREQIRIYLYDDFVKEPLSVVRDCFRFLGVDGSFVPSRTPAPLVSGIPRGAGARGLIRAARAAKNRLQPLVPRSLLQPLQSKFMALATRKVRMPAELRAELTSEFRRDVLELERLIGRDLSAWLH